MSNPGESASDYSEKPEKLFQRGMGEGQYILFQNFCWSYEASATYEKQFAP